MERFDSLGEGFGGGFGLGNHGAVVVGESAGGGNLAFEIFVGEDYGTVYEIAEDSHEARCCYAPGSRAM